MKTLNSFSKPEKTGFIFLETGFSQGESIEGSKEARDFVRNLTDGEVETIQKLIGEKISNLPEERQKKVLDEVLALSQREVTKPLIQFLRIDMAKGLNEILLGEGLENSVTFKFQTGKPGMKEIGDDDYFNTKEIKSFVDPQGDDLQKLLQIEKRDGTGEMKTGFIHPDLGLVDGEGMVLGEYEGKFNLGEIVQDDLSHSVESRNLSVLLESPRYLLEAIRAMNPGTNFNMEDASLLYEVIKGKVTFVSPAEEGEKNAHSLGEVLKQERVRYKKQIYLDGQASVARLQQAFINVSPVFSAKMGGVDGKYGKGTRRTVRSLGIALHEAIDEFGKFDMGFTMEVVANPTERVKIYRGYDEIALVADHSVSMGDDTANTARVIEMMEDGKEGRKQSYSFSVFEREAYLMVPLTGDPDAKQRLADTMRGLKVQGGLEYGMDAAIKMLQDPRVFSNKEKVTYINEKDEQVTEDVERLMEVITDEGLQGVSLAEVRYAKQLCERKNVDLVFVFSTEENGVNVRRVPVNVIEQILIERLGPVKEADYNASQISWEGTLDDASRMRTYVNNEDKGFELGKFNHEFHNMEFNQLENRINEIDERLKENLTEMEQEMLWKERKELLMSAFIWSESNPRDRRNKKELGKLKKNDEKMKTVSLRELENMEGLTTLREDDFNELQLHLKRKKARLFTDELLDVKGALKYMDKNFADLKNLTLEKLVEEVKFETKSNDNSVRGKRMELMKEKTILLNDIFDYQDSLTAQ